MTQTDRSIKDGIALMYIKDGTLYPIAITEEQYTMLTIMVSSICQPLNVLINEPQGKAVNLKTPLRKDGTL